MRLGRWFMKMALVVAVGLSLGYWVRSAFSPPSACRSSHLPESTPGARIESILAEPFLGSPSRHCILFLDDHEEVVRGIGKDGVPYLVRALRDDEPDVRLKATLCLSVLGSDAAPAVDGLRPLLRGRKDRQAYWAIICLGEIGKASAPSIPDLLTLLEHPRGCPFAQQIGEAVALIGLDGGMVPEELSQWLSHDNPGVRQTALLALGESGELARPVLPRVIASLNDPHLLVRVHAARSLGKLRQEQEVTLPALLRSLNDPKPSVRCAAAMAIGDFGSEAAEAVPELMKLLGHPSSRLRGDAATALGKIGPRAKQAQPMLRKLLADEYPRVREAAGEALPKISADVGESRPILDGQEAR